MNAPRDLAELIERGPESVFYMRQLRQQVRLLGRNRAFDGLELERERNEPLLASVVEGAVAWPPRLSGLRGDPGSRGARGTPCGVRDCRAGHELIEGRDACLGE